ncbi:MAG: hypothetical protein HFH03_11505 [Dorea sp.]|nr:hypothetical protein [Dorea sp.]
MKIKKMRCGVCDNHCEIEAEIEDGQVQDVTGNGCMKGFIFAQQEIREMEENLVDRSFKM